MFCVWSKVHLECLSLRLFTLCGEICPIELFPWHIWECWQEPRFHFYLLAVLGLITRVMGLCCVLSWFVLVVAVIAVLTFLIVVVLSFWFLFLSPYCLLVVALHALFNPPPPQTAKIKRDNSAFNATSFILKKRSNFSKQCHPKIQNQPSYK